MPSEASALLAKPATAASGPPRSFSYRHDIDGLRAVAVVAVTFFHIDATWLPGGFLGVDIFYVISGFVVTGSLLHAPPRAR